MLAALAHEALPVQQSIDLVNVAFDRPRRNNTQEPGVGNSKLQGSPFESCPDRITGRASFEEIQRVCKGRRWNLVTVDVSYPEVLSHREKTIALMHPHHTEMDFSISLALYFASRGQGTLEGKPYHVPAKVLVSGFGADEMLAGYSRHANAFRRRGFEGLLDELDLDIRRISTRNLGRDDRVLSHWGREMRYPFLDERVVDFLLKLPVSQKCGFHLTENQPLPLRSDKLLLRQVAWEMGLKTPAQAQKRAIQFGARTAKMKSSKAKGGDSIS